MSSLGRAGVYVEICADPPPVEIEQNDSNLHISRYVDTSEEEERTDVAEAVWKLRELEQGNYSGKLSTARPARAI